MGKCCSKGSGEPVETDFDEDEPKKQDRLAAAGLEDVEGEQIEENVYGAAIFSVIYDLYEFQSGKDHDGMSLYVNIFRFVFIVMTLAGNYTLQFALLYWVYYYVASPAVHKAQKTYRDYHALTFKKVNGTLAYDKDLWEQWAGVDTLCGLAYSNFWFMYAVVALWWIMMLKEVRSTERLWRKFRQLDHCPKAEDMILKGESEGEHHLIKGLTFITRGTLYFVLLLPKFFIAMFLTLVGTVWLTSSDQFSDLILNSVALEFIICIDEILYDGLLPESIKHEIQNTMLVMPKPKKTGHAPTDAKNNEDKTRQGYIRSVGYAVTIGLGLYLFMTYGQQLPEVGVYPNYKDDAACPIWWEHQTERICQPGVECFPIIGHAVISKQVAGAGNDVADGNDVSHMGRAQEQSHFHGVGHNGGHHR